MPECYTTKRGYQLKCDRPLHRGWEVKMAFFSIIYFLNDPMLELCNEQHFTNHGLGLPYKLKFMLEPCTFSCKGTCMPESSLSKGLVNHLQRMSSI